MGKQHLLALQNSDVGLANTKRLATGDQLLLARLSQTVMVPYIDLVIQTIECVRSPSRSVGISFILEGQ